MGRVGILGGTFDPPHIGHLVLADCAIESLKLDHLLFVPAADPPHKRSSTRLPIEHRLPMLERALAADSRFEISRVDIDRPGPHYTVDTVEIIQNQYPDCELFFVMGSDSLRDIITWHRPDLLIERVRLAVMQRPTASIEPGIHASVLPRLEQRVVIIDAPRLEISSTEIVERLRQGKTVRYLVPQPVLDYIEMYGVYRG
ncbi:MAG: nicotinate-nucleotide adenylyltransferase [Chloroflexota bacterium]|nr:MAG: nicotinic acid mononucleotide adenylyltransferase [Chloroflexota bacterium]